MNQLHQVSLCAPSLLHSLLALQMVFPGHHPFQVELMLSKTLLKLGHMMLPDEIPDAADAAARLLTQVVMQNIAENISRASKLAEDMDHKEKQLHNLAQWPAVHMLQKTTMMQSKFSPTPRSWRNTLSFHVANEKVGKTKH